jgi:hypothetical protein
MTVYTIDKGAHHLDLREPIDSTDPQSVKDVRKKETATIKQWILDYERGYSS